MSAKGPKETANTDNTPVARAKKLVIMGRPEWCSVSEAVLGLWCELDPITSWSHTIAPKKVNKIARLPAGPIR
jgi:hypothetical protein